MRSVVVIGAGPAGCVAALILARAGVRVTLIEQHRFPRNKVCGECLSDLALTTLERLGLASRVRTLGPTILNEIAIHSAGGAEYHLALPRPMWGISRGAFDELLLNEAKGAGVEVLQPVRCESISVDPVGIRVRDLQTNDVRTLDAEQILLCDGKGSLIDPVPKSTGDFGIKAHFQNIESSRNVIELFGCRGLYGGLSAIEGGISNTAFSVPAKRLYEHRGNIDALFKEIRHENPCLDRRFTRARQVTDWIAAPLPRFSPRRDVPTGITLVGNAAAALEPIGGEGMGLAIASAEIAALNLCDHPVKSIEYIFQEYQRLWKVRRASCRMAARIISSPTASRVLLPLLNLIPPTQLMSMALLGKA
jgi:flavin-dependent dehydrogenase